MAEHDPTRTHVPGAGGAPTWEEAIDLYRQAARIQADVHPLMDSKAAEGVDPAEIASAVGLQLLEASTMFARVTAAASLAHLNMPMRYMMGLPSDEDGSTQPGAVARLMQLHEDADVIAARLEAKVAQTAETEAGRIAHEVRRRQT